MDLRRVGAGCRDHARVRHRGLRHGGGWVQRRPLLARGAPIAVRLPGGTLDVTVDEVGAVTMRGPARLVFSGEVDVARFA